MIPGESSVASVLVKNWIWLKNCSHRQYRLGRRAATD